MLLVKMDCHCRKLSPFFCQFFQLSVNQKKIVTTFLSNVACRQNPLEDLYYGCDKSLVMYSFTWPCCTANLWSETVVLY